MKKITSIFAILLFGVVSLSAQNAFVGGHNAWTFAIQGGPIYSLNENGFSYRENGRGWDLFTLQGSAAIGYEFTQGLGVRVSVGYGKNMGAANVRQTAAGGFYPYSFKSINGFVDGTLDLNGNYAKVRAFRPRLYAGLGMGYTYDFTDSKHPWQEAYITKTNYVFGFRGGFIAEYDFTSWFGIFADLCGEAYKDNYNGLQPSQSDQDQYKGYAGFPLDLRGMLSFGVIFRINN